MDSACGGSHFSVETLTNGKMVTLRSELQKRHTPQRCSQHLDQMKDSPADRLNTAFFVDSLSSDDSEFTPNSPVVTSHEPNGEDTFKIVGGDASVGLARIISTKRDICVHPCSPDGGTCTDLDSLCDRFKTMNLSSHSELQPNNDISANKETFAKKDSDTVFSPKTKYSDNGKSVVSTFVSSQSPGTNEAGKVSRDSSRITRGSVSNRVGIAATHKITLSDYDDATRQGTSQFQSKDLEGTRELSELQPFERPRGIGKWRAILEQSGTNGGQKTRDQTRNSADVSQTPISKRGFAFPFSYGRGRGTKMDNSEPPVEVGSNTDVKTRDQTQNSTDGNGTLISKRGIGLFAARGRGRVNGKGRGGPPVKSETDSGVETRNQARNDKDELQNSCPKSVSGSSCTRGRGRGIGRGELPMQTGVKRKNPPPNNVDDNKTIISQENSVSVQGGGSNISSARNDNPETLSTAMFPKLPSIETLDENQNSTRMDKSVSRLNRQSFETELSAEINDNLSPLQNRREGNSFAEVVRSKSLIPPLDEDSQTRSLYGEPISVTFDLQFDSELKVHCTSYEPDYLKPMNVVEIGGSDGGMYAASSAETLSEHKYNVPGFLKNGFGSCLPRIWKRNIEKTKEKILNNLKLILGKQYLDIQKEHQEEFMIKQDFHKTQLSSAFALEFQTKNKIIQSITQDKDIFHDMPNKSFKNIVLLGLPNSGKTTFCAWLAYHWSCEKSPVDMFTICLSLEAKAFDQSPDMLGSIVTFLTNRLAFADYKHNENDVRTALQCQKVKILLVLDGYDEMSNSGKQNLNWFLRNRGEIANCTLVLTTRPPVEPGWLNNFDRVIQVKGFSFEHLQSILKSAPIPSIRVHSFVNYKKREFRLIYLSDLPVIFLGCIYRMVAGFCFGSEYKGNLQCLLDNATEILGETFKTSCDKYEAVYKKLGKLMFEAMVRGLNSFTERLLSDFFKEDFEFVRRCRVFFQGRGDNTNVWTVSSKSLMVYFATHYLRRCWEELASEKQRLTFLKRVFLCGDSVGDYVTRQAGNKRKTYMVGIIPDIVLDLCDGGSLESATFEMLYDVEDVELSQAFDSVNLLARLGRKHLERYQFQDVEPRDEECSPIFQNLLNCLEVPDLCVDYFFYQNKYEECDFLKVVISDFDDQNSALSFVCKIDRNNRIRRFQIDLSLSQRKDLFNVFRIAMMQVLPGLVLGEGLVDAPYGELVFSLVEAFMACSLSSPLSVTCFEDAEVVRRPLESVNFSIYRCQDWDQNAVLMTSSKHFGRCRSVFQPTSKNNLLNFKKDMLLYVREWLGKSPNPCISVNVY